MEPTLLALDTSTEAMAIAVLSPTGTWLRNAAGGASASAKLLPAVLALMAQAGVTMQQLDAVAFGHGPGAFTGLRTACSVAQGLAFGIDRPVLAIDSLMLVADDAQAQLPAPDSETLHWVAMDARMDEVYAAAYVRHHVRQHGPQHGPRHGPRHGPQHGPQSGPQHGRWSEHVAPALYTLPALAAHWSVEPPARVAGSAVTVFGERLPLAGATVVAREHDRAAALARLARLAWNDGRMIDPAQALPLYLRDKVALTTAERLAQRAASAAASATHPA